MEGESASATVETTSQSRRASAVAETTERRSVTGLSSVDAQQPAEGATAEPTVEDSLIDSLADAKVTEPSENVVAPADDAGAQAGAIETPAASENQQSVSKTAAPPQTEQSATEMAAAPQAEQSATESLTSTNKSHKEGGKTLRRVGTEVVAQVKLPQWQLDETSDRLSKPKERKEEANHRAKAVQLKYVYDKTLRGGKGGYKETLVPAKKVTAQEKQDYMVTLADRCKETRLKTKATLREKYLQPLTPNSKKIAAGDEMEQHLQKIDRLYHGQGVSG